LGDLEVTGSFIYFAIDGRRLNALTLTGLPISCLKTQALFAYSSHFDSAPTGLEWINDWTVVFVYESTKSAKTALRNLRKFMAEDPDEEEFYTAKPIPVNFWPPGTRVQVSLGRNPDGEVRDMKSRILVRVSRTTDAKEKGAQSASEFYKKHGRTAGKEMYETPVEPRRKRQREPDGLDESEEVKRSRLDAELDAIHSSDNREAVGEVEEIRIKSLRDRISGSTETKQHLRRIRGRKPTATKESLDDELDAFLRGKD